MNSIQTIDNLLLENKSLTESLFAAQEQRDSLRNALINMIVIEDTRFNLESHGLADGVDLSDLTAARAAIAKAQGAP